MQATTSVLPGFAILRRPSPHKDSAEPAPAQPRVTTTGNTTQGPSTHYVAGALLVWLEAVAGRRPITVLSKGPYHKRVLQLAREHNVTGQHGQNIQLRSLHVQEPRSSLRGHRNEVRFCASVMMGTRVRALAGVLCLRKVARTQRWILETLTLV